MPDNEFAIPPRPAAPAPQPARHPHALQPQWVLENAALFASQRVDRLRAAAEDAQRRLAAAEHDLSECRKRLAAAQAAEKEGE